MITCRHNINTQCVIMTLLQMQFQLAVYVGCVCVSERSKGEGG